MTITLSLSQIILIVVHFLLIIGGVGSFKNMTSGGGDAGLIGFMMWCGIGIALEILIWLVYFAVLGVMHGT